MIYRYASILIALFVTLGALQIPSFLNQYQNRVSAHLIEVETNLAGFQAIANRRHGGSITALIEHHRRSSDATFRDEADVIAAMVDRRNRFRTQLQALEGSLANRVWFVTTQADGELFRETAHHYTWTVTLDRDALICGGIGLVGGIVLLDLIALILSRLFFRRRPASR